MQVTKRMGSVFIAYIICFLSRALLDTFRYIYDSEKAISDKVWRLIVFLKLLNTLSNKIKWFILFVFIFQVQEVKLRLQAETPSELSVSLKAHNRRKFIVYPAILIFEGTVMCCHILDYPNIIVRGDPEFKTLATVEIISKSILLLSDLYVAWMFLGVINFYLHTKKKK